MLTQFSNQLAELVDATARSVVQVQGHRRPASGVVFADTAVLTTTRAIAREDGVRVCAHDGAAFDAAVAGWDPATGLAVLRAPGLQAPAIMLSQTPVRVGHVALALARSWSNAVTASLGVVAVIGGPLRTGRRHSIDQVFRTTAPMHEGFAGGAVLDSDGRAIGIGTAASIRGLGVVIPASIAWRTAQALLKHGGLRRGHLGIAGQGITVSEPQRAASGRAGGVLVVTVTPGGPASQAGVVVGDILLAIGDSEIDTPEALVDALQSHAPGTGVAVRILRGTAVHDITVTLGERPAA